MGPPIVHKKSTLQVESVLFCGSRRSLCSHYGSEMRRALTLFHQIILSQDIRAETQSWSRPAEAQVRSEVTNLQAELQNTLRALQQQQDPANLLDDDKVHQAAFQSRLSPGL